MTYILYDAVVPTRIPRAAKWVAGYVDGQWPTYSELARLFPKARTISITTGAEIADVIDIERGNATADQAVNWAVRMRGLDRRPIVYTSLANRDVVLAAFHASQVPPPFFWIADWTNIPHLVPGSVATQYASLSGEGYDVSLVSPDFPSTYQRRGIPMNIQLNVKQLIANVENFVRKTGSWAVVVNDFTHTVGISPTVKAVLTAVAGAIFAIDHQNTKATKTPPKA